MCVRACVSVRGGDGGTGDEVVDEVVDGEVTVMTRRWRLVVVFKRGIAKNHTRLPQEPSILHQTLVMRTFKCAEPSQYTPSL